MESSGLPVPDAIQPLLEQLQEALLLESKYQPNLQLTTSPQNDEITIGMRDESAHVLRCLKVWYDVPSDVLFIAINLMDRFLTKMKARPKHMACISVSAFHIAAVQMAQESLDADHLVSISQCKCTGGDLKRMSEVIRNKLDWVPGTQPVTALTFLRIFHLMFQAFAAHHSFDEVYNSLVKESELFSRLEMVACDGECASLRQSEVALAFLCNYVETVANRYDEKNRLNMSGPTSFNEPQTAANRMSKLLDFSTELQIICKIPQQNYITTRSAVNSVLFKYNSQERTACRQRLIWKLSSRTARLLRPTDRFTSVLPVIDENTPTTTPKRYKKSRMIARRQGDKKRGRY